ncbi:hypothetical protein ACFIPR_003199 [Enterobacter kobei]
MARKNEKIRVDIDGDSTGLSKALQDAENRIDKFGKNAGGSLGGFASSTSSVFGKLSTGIGGLAALSAGAAVSVGALVLKTNDLVRELNQLAKQSGLSVTELQKLQKAFKATGFDAEKFADINQDALDKLSDAYRNGGGIADDMISVGLDPKKYSKFLNDKDGGLKAVIQAFYDLKKAGASVGDQKFFLESWASDASKLTGVLDESKDAADAWNKIASQTVAVTEDQAKVYAEFDKHLSELKTTSQDYLIQGLTPIVNATNNLLDAYGKEAPDTLFESLKDKALATYDVLKYLNPNYYLSKGISAGLDATGLFPDNKPKPKAPQVNPKLPLGQATVSTSNESDDPFKLNEKAKAAADKAQKAAEAAAKAQKAIADKAAKERIDAQKALDKILVDQTVGTNERQLAEFKRQQAEIVATIKKSAKTLGLSDTKLQELLNDQLTAGAASRLQMINQMIGYNDPNQQMKDQNALLAGGQLNQGQSDYLGNQLDQGLGLDTTSYDQQAMNAERDAMLKQNELLLQSKEEFEKRKAAITAKYAVKAVQIQNQETTKLLQGMEESFGTIGQGMADAFGKSSGAAQAAFAVQRGLTISMTIMKIQEALAGALALPFPENIPQYAQIAAMGMSIISTAKGASSGQFHGGVDELPSSYDNKSFVLKAGERVVQPEANKKLTQFLDSQDAAGGSTGSGDIIVNAPMYNYGTQDDKAFQEKLKKHQNSIVQAVKDSQRRNT